MLLDTAKNYALGGLLIACLLLGLAGWAAHERAGIVAGQRDLAEKQYEDLGKEVRAMQRKAADQLRAEQATVLAQQRRLEAARAQQEKDDATNLDVVRALRADLERLREQAQRARRGGGGGGAAGGDPIGAFHRAGGAAAAGGLLPAPPAGAADEDEDAYAADLVNLAYGACRADALKLREVLNASSSAPPHPPSTSR